jgi:hypothetical protein
MRRGENNTSTGHKWFSERIFVHPFQQIFITFSVTGSVIMNQSHYYCICNTLFMKRKILIGAFLSALAVLLMNSSNGAGASQNADRTGSPVANGNCNGCHSGGVVTPTVTVALFDGLLPVTTYTPGKAYTLRISVLGLGYPRYGFQTVALATGNVNAGTMTAGSTGTRVVTVNGRKYGEHSAPGTTGIFELNWTAPAAGTGTVTFYTAGLGAANPSGDNGDKANTNSITVTEASGMSVMGISGSEFQFGPNPVIDELHFYTGPMHHIRVFDLHGAEVAHQKESANSISLQNLKSGIYLVQAVNEQGKEYCFRILK